MNIIINNVESSAPFKSGNLALELERECRKADLFKVILKTDGQCQTIAKLIITRVPSKCTFLIEDEQMWKMHVDDEVAEKLINKASSLMLALMGD